MPYFKGKKFNLNIYTLINTHWTDGMGNSYPPALANEDQYVDQRLLNIITELFASTEYKNVSRVLPPKLVPGFIPSKFDNATNFYVFYKELVPDCSWDPLKFNTTFCCCIPTASENAPQSRKGTKVTLSSIYITGTIHKPEVPLSLPNDNAPSISKTRCIQSLTNNQITYYIVYQQCRNQGETIPDWSTIFYTNGSNKVCPDTYARRMSTNLQVDNNGDRVNSLLSTEVQPAGQPPTLTTTRQTSSNTGWSRFTNPMMYINVDNREKFAIVASYTLDLDNENTQFDFKIYEKMKVAPPSSNSKKKTPIQVVYSNNSNDNKLNNVEYGAVYLVRACYGVYNTLLVSGVNTATGTTVSLTSGINASNSYMDGLKLYPNEDWTMKLNYYDL